MPRKRSIIYHHYYIKQRSENFAEGACCAPPEKFPGVLQHPQHPRLLGPGGGGVLILELGRGAGVPVEIFK